MSNDDSKEGQVRQEYTSKQNTPILVIKVYWIDNINNQFSRTKKHKDVEG